MSNKVELMDGKYEVKGWRRVSESSARAELGIDAVELRHGYFTQSDTGQLGWWEAGLSNYSTLNVYVDGRGWDYGFSCAQLPDHLTRQVEPVVAEPRPATVEPVVAGDEGFCFDNGGGSRF